MNKSYIKPLLSVVEVEMEGSILSNSITSSHGLDWGGSGDSLDDYDAD